VATSGMVAPVNDQFAPTSPKAHSLASESISTVMRHARSTCEEHDGSGVEESAAVPRIRRRQVRLDRTPFLTCQIASYREVSRLDDHVCRAENRICRT
jgi:hypothetical protein